MRVMRLALWIYLVLVTAGLVGVLLYSLLYVDTTDKEGKISTAKILKAFDGRKESVAVKDIFPEDWDYVCMNWDYSNADESIRMDLKLTTSDHLQISPENIYFAENEKGLSLVKKISPNNYEVEVHKYYPSVAEGLRLTEDLDNRACADRSNSYLQLFFTNDNLAAPRLVFTNKRKLQ